MSRHVWFRFYDEVVDDPKVQTLPLILFRAWVNLLCIANKHGGELPELKEISYRLHVTESRARDIVDALIAADLFERVDGVTRPHNWDGRQYKSDISTDRVKRFRNARRNEKGNVSETANETDQSRADTEPPVVPQGADAVKYSPEFEAFWKSYPRHDGKGAAFRAWNKLRPSQVLQAQMIQRVEAQKLSEQWRRDNGQFVPHASTWINERRFDDDDGAKTTPSQPKLEVVL